MPAAPVKPQISDNGNRIRRRVDPLIPIGLIAALLAILLFTPLVEPGPFVSKVTIANKSEYAFDVDVAGAHADGWMASAPRPSARARTSPRSRPGPHLDLSFPAGPGRRPVAMVAADLEAAGWQMTIPDDFADQLRAGRDRSDIAYWLSASRKVAASEREPPGPNDCGAVSIEHVELTARRCRAPSGAARATTASAPFLRIGPDAAKRRVSCDAPASQRGARRHRERARAVQDRCREAGRGGRTRVGVDRVPYPRSLGVHAGLIGAHRELDGGRPEPASESPAGLRAVVAASVSRSGRSPSIATPKNREPIIVVATTEPVSSRVSIRSRSSVPRGCGSSASIVATVVSTSPDLSGR